jgi:hypothetical protein
MEIQMFVYRFKFRNRDLKVYKSHKILASNESQAMFFIKRKLGNFDWYPSSCKRSYIVCE